MGGGAGSGVGVKKHAAAMTIEDLRRERVEREAREGQRGRVVMMTGGHGAGQRI
jgi:hypothetical protein